jgi:AcrR family transcriptional regulator
MVRVTKAPDERRSELIATAQKLFLEKGYENASVSDIVKAVGVAQGTFYYYFNSKEDVLEAITVNLVEELRASLVTIAEDPSLSPIEKWKRAVIASSDYKIGRKKEMMELMRASKTINNYQLQERYRQISREKISQLFVDILKEGIEAGMFHTDYPEESAKIAIVIGKSISDDLKNILMNPQKYTDPIGTARRKFNAVQTAMERVLAAPNGSLKLVSEEMLEDWFGR